MKMVILEVAGDYAAALSDDGTISRIPNQNYRVGQTLLCPSRKEQSRFTVYARRIAAVAAVFVLMLTGAGVLLRMPVTYVSLDVNPSVEYKLNVFDQVVEVVTINEDAKELLKDTTLVDQSADQAIKQTVELLGKNNYLKTEEKNDIVISATSTVTSKSKSVLSTVTQATQEAAASMDVKADIIVYESSMSDLKQAEKLETTPGKMWLVNQIVETDVQTMDPQAEEASEVQTYLQMPVTELVSVISEDGLAQISQTNESISYIQTEHTDVQSDPESSDILSASSGMESENTQSDVNAATPSEIDTGSSSTSVSENESSSEVPDTSEIPSVTPGTTTSETEDETTTSKPENSLGTPDEPVTSQEVPDSSEIPSVKPGINAKETSDTEADQQTENSPDVTTSAPKESDVLSDETVTSSEDTESDSENVCSE